MTTPSRLTPDERYRRDPVFCRLVDQLREALRGGEWTPTELREAAMLAAVIHELETIRPLFIGSPYVGYVGRGEWIREDGAR